MRINWFSYIRVTGLFLVLIYHFFPSILPGASSVLMSSLPSQGI